MIACLAEGEIRKAFFQGLNFMLSILELTHLVEWVAKFSLQNQDMLHCRKSTYRSGIRTSPSGQIAPHSLVGQWMGGKDRSLDNIFVECRLCTLKKLFVKFFDVGNHTVAAFVVLYLEVVPFMEAMV